MTISTLIRSSLIIPRLMGVALIRAFHRLSALLKALLIAVAQDVFLDLAHRVTWQGVYDF